MSLVVGVDRPLFDPQTFGILTVSMRACSYENLTREKQEINISIEVFPVKDYDVEQLFLELNEAERVQEIDLPDAIAPFDKQIIDSAVRALNRKYEQMFKSYVKLVIN